MPAATFVVVNLKTAFEPSFTVELNALMLYVGVKKNGIYPNPEFSILVSFIFSELIKESAIC